MQNYQRIRDLREDADWTQKQVADLLFLHLNQYRRYECGERDIPLGFAIKLAQLYNVSIDYIAGITNQKLGLTKSKLDKDETELLQRFQKLSPINKGRLLERAEYLYKK